VRLQTWQMEVEIERLLEESPADPRRHLNQDRVRRYAEVLDQLPPVVVFELGDPLSCLLTVITELPPRSSLLYKPTCASVPKSRLYSSRSMLHVPNGVCRLTRHERLFGITAMVRATMLETTVDFDCTARSLTYG
jgi:hypothetical protein